jgi:DNA-binding transcriptional regulator YdaS (Cro superfamily)
MPPKSRNKPTNEQRIGVLLDFINQLDAEQKQCFASGLGTSPAYLLQIAYGHAKASPLMALAIAKATGYKVTPHALLPNVYPYPSDGIPLVSQLLAVG